MKQKKIKTFKFSKPINLYCFTDVHLGAKDHDSAKFKRVSNYLAAITDMDNLTTVVLKADGKETTLLMEEMFDSREDMVDYLKSTTYTPEVAVLVDEWNNAEVVDLDNQVVYAS